MKILVTGFEPFNHETINPSYEAVKALPDQIDGVQIVKIEVPVVYARCLEPIQRVLERETIDAIVLVGQAGGRTAFTPEKVAINFRSASIPDNDGVLLKDTPIDPLGPDACFSTLPVRKIQENVSASGIASQLSLTAGAFVCNDLFYSTMHYLAGCGLSIPAGFIHVPFIPEQLEGKPAGTPSMPLDEIERALTIALETVICALKK